MCVIINVLDLAYIVLIWGKMSLSTQNLKPKYFDSVTYFNASKPIKIGGRYILYALGFKIVHTGLIGLHKISSLLP